MMTFKEFLKFTEDANSQEKGLFANIPGNPAFGGKKPSDGQGKDPNLSNQPGNSGTGQGGMGGPQMMMMKKKMKKK